MGIFENQVMNEIIEIDKDFSKNNNQFDLDLILESIEAYINDSYHRRAIMIDGEWGTGKTYFIKETLIPILKSKYDYELPLRNIGLISLYGISTKQDFDKAILNALFPISVSKYEKLIDGTKKIIFSGLNKLLAGAGTVAEGATNLLTADNLINTIEAVLIFDDLERCKLKITELFGYINNYIEQDNKKVIIVLNSENYKPKDEANKEKKKNIDLLNEFEEAKEKTVELTLLFDNSIEKSFDSIVKVNAKYNYSINFFQKNKIFITSELTKIKPLNLRKVIYVVQLFDKITSIIDNNLDKDFLDSHLLKIWQYICNYKFEIQSFPLIIKHISIENYFKTGVLDKKQFIDELKSYAKEYEINEKSSLSKLEKWRIYDRQQINQLLDILKKELVNHVYDVISFPRILYIILFLRKLGFYGLPLKELLSSTIASIGGNYNLLDRWQTYITKDEEIQKLYEKRLRYIHKIINKRKDNEYRSTSVPLNCEWNYDFEKFCKKSIMFFLDINKFLFYLDFNNDNLKNLTPTRVYYFLCGIRIVYSKMGVKAVFKGHIFEDDIPNITKLINILSNCLNNSGLDVILKHNIIELIDYLKETLDRIKKPNKIVIEE